MTTTPNAPDAALHIIKCWPDPYEAMARGDKTAEFRRNDRNFKVGDTLLIREWCPVAGAYTHREMLRAITHVLSEGFGLPNGYAMLSIAPAFLNNDLGTLPCPFCGDHGVCAPAEETSEAEPENRDALSYGVGCSCTAYVGPWATKVEAIAAWNRRAGQSHADAALLAALEDIEKQAYNMISGIDRYNEKHGEFIGGGLVFQLARSVGVARAAIAAAKGACK